VVDLPKQPSDPAEPTAASPGRAPSVDR
jgi:hypothetical protein